MQSGNEKYYPFVGISFEALSESYNLDLKFISDLMKEEILDNISEDRWHMFNAFCLRLIKAYDHVRNVEYLYIAQDILKRLNETDEENEFTKSINLMQVQYRLDGKLKNDDIKKLIDYKKKSHVVTNEMKLLHINTLLKNKADAIDNYENLSETEKLDFSKYPMYHLFKENI